MKRLILWIVLGIILLVITSNLLAGYAEECEASTALQAEQYQHAGDLFKSSAEKLFWRKDLYEQAGIAAYLNQDYTGSIQYFKQASIVTPEGWDYFGLAYYLNNQPQDAVNTWKQGIQYFPTHAPIYRRLSLYDHHQKQYDDEKEMLTRYLELKPDDASAHFDLGILLVLDDPDGARKQFQSASSLDDEFDSVSQSLISALAVADQESAEDARLLILGRALGLVYEWDLAREAFERAAKINQKNAEARAWLGEAKQQTGQDGRAELDRALSLDSESAIVRSLRGLYWRRQGNLKNALDEYLHAIETDPNNPAWLAAVGETYEGLGDLPRALDYYQRATSATPNDSTYWRLLASFCAANNLYIEDVGLPAALKAVELSPKDALALHSLGWVYYVSGRLTLAEQTLSQAIKLDKTLFIARIHLGLTFLAENDRASAYKEFIFVRDADKNGEYGKQAQELLKQYFP